MPFQRIKNTDYPPSNKPLMVWDGHCGFCAFWITRWKRMTRGAIDYRTYAEVADDFPDIDVKAFQQAVRLLEPNGRVFSGAEAAFRSFQYGTSWGWLWPLYVENKWLRIPSNAVYDWIAKHRPLMQKITVALLGNNPEKLKHYWVLYILAIAGVAVLVIVMA